ncbi:hypothetical protein [Terribacillus saccharophilus]|uniref:Uncharacterized protein n=1 Tax=Terribacillus saccharophilus TaxID=361277 RepID=A0A268AB94_9BACI|nr:hypothetical protein [Terribacillus saccharophilus]PAD21329.1 hypothetical protein CHH64_09325 [Terribacillus saccharophilus]
MSLGKEIKQNLIKNAMNTEAKHQRFKQSLKSFYLNNREKEYQQNQLEMSQLLKDLDSRQQQ